MAPTENKVWYLRRSRLFERASEDVVGGCEHLFVQNTFDKGAVVFEQGDVGRYIYMIKIGRVRVSRATADGKELAIAWLGPGDLFGEEVVFTKVDRTTKVTCLEDTLLCYARAEDLYGLMTRHAALAINIAKYISEQRDDALAVAEDFASLSVPERLVKLLERLATEHGSPCPEGRRLNIQLTHGEIASLIGSTRETVSLQMGLLRRDGRIRMSGRDIVLV